MPEYLSPGVYVEEIDSGPLPIEGVSTSTAGFVGVTQRGSTTDPPSLVTSFADFTWQFGSYFDFGWAGAESLPYAVNGFFANGGQRLYIVRVAGAGSSAATVTPPGGITTRLAQDTSMSAPTTIKLLSLRAIDRTVNLTLTQVKLGVTTTSGAIAIAAYDPTTNAVTLGTALTQVFEAKYTTVTTSVASPGPSITVNAHDVGSWGNSLVVTIADSKPAAQSDVLAIVGPYPSSNVQLRSAAGFYVNAWVQFDQGPNVPPASPGAQSKAFGRIQAINGNVITIDPATLTAFASATALDPNGAMPFTRCSTCEFNLTAALGNITESYTGLVLENVTGRNIAAVINPVSTLLNITGTPAATSPMDFPTGADGMTLILGTGTDGTAPGAGDMVGVDNGPGARTGIQALGDIDEISIIGAPGWSDPVVQGALIGQCELRKDRFAILDPSNTGPETMNDIQSQRSAFDTHYAAIYYPRLLIFDPLSQSEAFPCPPSGHVAGIYARVDDTRGVFKAPANEVLQGITGLELTINKQEQDILNPEPVCINVLRDFRSIGRSFRVWGARCITSDVEWMYVPVRRLFIFLEKSLTAGLQPLVFEPNDQKLWARVIQAVTDFLTGVWQSGGLMGAKPEEAFFVHCSDTTTMTADDILNGRLIVVIGVAPVRPAEFVIIRIGQWVGGSSVSES